MDPAGRPLAARADDLVRERLLRRLDATSAGALIVLSAPGGWGKTTLLRTWTRTTSAERAFCWCDLSPADDDPRRFIDRLMGAVAPVVGNQWGPAAGLTTAVWVEDVLPRLHARLAEAGPTVIVLDDYHVVTSAEIHHVVQALVDDLPDGTSVAVSTRIDPPLRLARLRAARRVVEWRAHDLRLSEEETDLLLRESFGVELDPDELRLLTTKAEGWPAAVSLAAVSLQGIDDAVPFLANFLASDRYLVDYLTEELLTVLPDEHRSFMRITSVVDRFTMPLAQLLTTVADTAAICDDLERRNLLTREHDGGRLWFRYHQLVRDHLRTQQPPDTRATLHRRAGAWFETVGLARLAIEQLMAAGDTDGASRLVVEHGFDYIMRGRMVTVMGWVDRLAETAGALTADVLLIGAQAAIYHGQLARGQPWLERAEALEPTTPRDQLRDLVLRTTLAHAQGRIVDAAGHSEVLMAILDANDDDATIAPEDRAEACYVAALARTLCGRSDARPLLDRCLATTATPGVGRVSAVAALGLKATMIYLRGDATAARAMATRAIALADELGLPPVSLPRDVPTSVLVLAGDDEVPSAIDDLRRMAEVVYSPYGTANIHLAIGSHYARIGEVDKARAEIEMARDLLDEIEQPGAGLERYYDLIVDQLPAAAVDDPVPGPDALTDRELQVLRAFSSNLTQREIGRELFLSFNTVKTYARSAYRKLGVSSRADAVEACRQAGLF